MGTCSPPDLPLPPAPGLFVATDLERFEVADSSLFAPDLQVDDRVFRLLDPAYYAWLRSRMEKARRARDAGRLPRDVFEVLRARFNAVHDWALTHLGEPELLAAVRGLVPGDYRPPVPGEPEDLVPLAPERSGSGPVTPGFMSPATGDWPVTEPVTPEAVARVDAIRSEALALGWSEARLYQNRGLLAFPVGQDYGLVCFLGDGTTIARVTREAIHLGTARGAELRFFNPDVEHPWCRRVRPEASPMGNVPGQPQAA